MLLIIKAKGGLGNRILSAATAIAYAEATNRDWCVDWRDGLYAPNGVNAISRLFQIHQPINLAEIDRCANVQPQVWAGRIAWPVRAIIAQDYPSQHSNPIVYRKLSARLTSKPSGAEIEIFWSYISKFGRIKPFLCKEQQKMGRDRVLEQVLQNHFAPKKPIIERVEKLIGGIKNEILGVHIRYTDLKVPLEKLIGRVSDEVDKFNYKSIFLATDSAHAEHLFREKFPNVITQDRRYCADNKQLHSVRDYTEKTKDADDALVDMITLSRCKGLVYCSRSTFAETSRLYGGIGRQRLVDVDRYNCAVQFKKRLQEYL